MISSSPVLLNSIHMPSFPVRWLLADSLLNLGLVHLTSPLRGHRPLAGRVPKPGSMFPCSQIHPSLASCSSRAPQTLCTQGLSAQASFLLPHILLPSTPSGLFPPRLPGCSHLPSGRAQTPAAAPSLAPTHSLFSSEQPQVVLIIILKFFWKVSNTHKRRK